jgi:TonB-dependent SusC/RagA subfamily outer membrane receptor
MTNQIKRFKILSKNFLKIFFILFILSTNQLFSQGQISGNVKDSDGIPLPGATIVEEGTLNGTSTDFDGNFTLTLENDESDILVSFVGYITETYPVEDGAVINASLSVDGGSLDEVVVTGFGTSQQKKLVSGSIATISSELIENRGLTSAGIALAGTTAGVMVTQNSGQAGRDDVQFRVRGYGTINDASPLIIIDGFEGDFNSLNPNDIESVSVLKDASAAAIYGNRAANGVILVKTKRGRKNQDLNITYDLVVGSAESTIDYPLVYDPAELARVHNQAKSNYGLPELFTTSDIAFLQSNVDSGLLGQDAQDIFLEQEL